MKRTIPLLLILTTILATGCVRNYDDFAISGTIIAHEQCTTMNDLGYAVQLDDPDSIGAPYRYITGKDTTIYQNVIVIYRPDRIIKRGRHITGRAYWDDNHSKAECNYNYRNASGDVPEACFTQLNEE